MLKAIVAVDRQWGIGKDGNLLVHLPGDLAFFKETTMGHPILVGRKTLEGFPGGNPLPGRENLILTGNPDFEKEGCTILHDMEEVLSWAENTGDLFVCGGESVYRQFLPFTETIYVTKIDAAFGADRFFPNLDEDPSFEVAEEGPAQEENGVAYRFVTYVRK